MARPLTDKQRKILDTVWTFTDDRGYPPTLAELAEALGLTASTVQGHVDRLIKKGALSRDGEGRRTLRVTEPSFVREKSTGLPLCGRIAAGAPIEAIEQAELVEVKDLVDAPDGSYVLEVTGDSMIEAGIFDGDYVIIDPNRGFRNGDIVVAITPDEEATLKEIYKEAGRIRLEPRNPTMSSMYYDTVDVRGVLVAVLRKTR